MERTVRSQMCLWVMVVSLLIGFGSAQAGILDLGSATTYSDNYNTNPLADPDNTPFWSYSTIAWYESGTRIQNSFSSNQTVAVYCITHNGAINGADIRLGSTDAASTATAAFANSGGVQIHVAVSTDDITYTDIYTGGWVQSEASNPGAFVDMTAYGSPETFYVKIYSTDESVAEGETANHFIYWTGFQLELDAVTVPEPATMVMLGIGSLGMVLKRKRG